MSQKAAIRRRRQHAHGFRHLGPLVRPHYKKNHLTVHQSITRERNQAAAEARRKVKSKK